MNQIHYPPFGLYHSAIKLLLTHSCLVSVLGVGLYKLIVIISAPIAIVKAGISVLQGVVGAINLSTIDINERAALAAKQNK